MIFKMSCGALLPVIASVLFYLAEKHTRFNRLSYMTRQIIIGIVFGGIAVLGTEFGVPTNGVMLNVRDAAPLSAGLIFGAPAGIIAGLIGGVERWFAVYWGVGSYTRVACSVSTLIAGILGALLRKYMFDNKKPAWYYGLAVGLVAEVIHMLSVFITNINDVRTAFSIIRLTAGTMIFFNGVSVMLAILAVTFIGKEKRNRKKDRLKLAQTFQRWLLVNVIIAFLVTSVFTLILQNGLAYNDAVNLLTLNIGDVRADINDASDENMLKLTHKVANELNASGDYSYESIKKIADEYDISEIDIIDDHGIIISCTNKEFVGFDMNSGEQSRAFLVLLDETEEYVQSYQPISYDLTISRKYAGVALKSGGFVQVGYDSEEFHSDISEQVIGATRNRHVGEGGCVIICDEDWFIVSDRHDYEGQNLVMTGIYIDRETMPESECFMTEVYGEKSLCMYEITEGYLIIAVMPESEALFTRDVSVYVTVFMEIIVFAVMFALIYFLVKKLVVENIQRINESLAKITDGNLNVTVDVRTNEEFASLSDDINSTVDTLKRYIAEAAARIDKELEFARSIQHSALPSVFPPYPNRADFDVYADMFTAKEVGGDFYDFYLLDEERLAFLIADVSGKGIPAAMFMMTSKTLIKSLIESGMPLREAFERANEKLCEGNETGMFVTAWMGIVNVKTGALTYVNAGHNPPLIRRGDGKYEYLRSRANFVLAGMEGAPYKSHEVQLEKGDMLYLYTDGVTEATDSDNRLYGEDRLLEVVNAHTDADVKELCGLVKEDVDLFVGEAPQFDDITMLAIEIKK